MLPVEEALVYLEPVNLNFDESRQFKKLLLVVWRTPSRYEYTRDVGTTREKSKA